MGSVFRNVDEEPVDETIRGALGPAADTWDQTVDLLSAAGAAVAWRYYRDGGWLAKATRGSKTVAWLAVDSGVLTVTFYFAERHRDVLRDTPGLPIDVRERIAGTALTGKLLPVTHEVRTSDDVAVVAATLAIKLAAK